MATVKQIILLIARLILASIAMAIAYTVGSMVIGDTGVVMTPEETAQAGRGLLIVSAISALVLSFLVIRSPWRGLKLIGALFVVQFGIETFMTQIETLYFNAAVQMENAMLIGIVAAGALRALIFAPLAVIIFGKLRQLPVEDRLPTPPLPANWIRSFVALSFFYVVVYFLFGYFVAWQWEATRLYYSGTAEIKPFFTHMTDLFLREDPFIIVFQLLRGALWTGLALLIVRMIIAKRWEAALAVALNFSLLLALPLILFPNPYMPPIVAQSHFVEIMTSMLLFGGVAGRVLYDHDGYD